MVEEFNLSKNIIRRTLDFDIHGDSGYDMFYLFDVKEFIRLLKEKAKSLDRELANGDYWRSAFLNLKSEIDALAGDKLI